MPLSLMDIAVPGLGGTHKDAALTCAFSYDGERCCVGVGSHVEQFLHDGTSLGPSISSASCAGRHLKEPVVSVAFKPEGANSKLRNVLAIGSSDGSVLYWHVGSHKVIASVQEENNEVYAVEYTQLGTSLLTAGKDTRVRVYDSDTLRCKSVLSDGPPGGASHSSRVQCLCAVDDHCVLSAGWDNIMCLWDTRLPKAVSSVYGPYVCGDAVSVFGSSILTCSARNDNQIQLWDLRNMSPLPVQQHTVSPAQGSSVASLYCGGFSPSGGEVVVGGTDLLATYSIQGANMVEVPTQGVSPKGSVFSVSRHGTKFLGCGSQAYFGKWL